MILDSASPSVIDEVRETSDLVLVMFIIMFIIMIICTIIFLKNERKRKNGKKKKK